MPIGFSMLWETPNCSHVELNLFNLVNQNYSRYPSKLKQLDDRVRPTQWIEEKLDVTIMGTQRRSDIAKKHNFIACA